MWHTKIQSRWLEYHCWETAWIVSFIHSKNIALSLFLFLSSSPSHPITPCPPHPCLLPHCLPPGTVPLYPPSWAQMCVCVCVCVYFLLAGCGSVGWASSCKPKGYGFSSKPEHMPRFRFQSQSGCIREATDGCFSLTLMFLSLSLFIPSPPSKINKLVLQ